MQTKRVLSAFVFTMLTIFLVLIVASRNGEAARTAQPGVDAAITVTPRPTPELNELPGGKEEEPDRTADKPDVDITSWEFILAGPSNNIGSYAPPGVVSIEGTAQTFDSRAITPLVDFLNAARAEGYTPYIQTAYRNYSAQQYLYNGRASQIAWPEYPTAEDYAEAEKSVAVPGESDHQTGLGVDITDRYYGVMDSDQMNQDFLLWLREHCAEYGFILRYPPAKEAITERSELYHFRYVGVEAAEYIMENNLCLEQFVALYK